MELTIYLRNERFVTVNGFEEISYLSSAGPKNIKADELKAFNIHPTTSYSFKGESSVITINGSDILYLEFEN